MKKVSIKMHTTDLKCKYKSHRTAGDSFGLELIAPEGMCLHAYASAYPYCLSLMYGAEFKFMPDHNSVSFQCPSPVDPVVMLAKRIRIDEKNIKIIISVKEIIHLNNNCQDSCKGICPMRVGQEFEFNHMGQRPEICPAGFMHIYPFLLTLLQGGKPLWQTGKNSFLVHCPDEKINVSYEVMLQDEN